MPGFFKCSGYGFIDFGFIDFRFGYGSKSSISSESGSRVVMTKNLKSYKKKQQKNLFFIFF
jgi:hypothetical protein